MYTELELPLDDVRHLSICLQRLIEHHAMLRMTVEPDGTQRVHREVPPYWIEMEDLSGLDPEAAEQVMVARRERVSHRVYRPEQWPLFDVHAFRRAPGRMRLCFSGDLLAFDLKSTQIMVEDLMALLLNPAAQLPRLSITFRDYVLAEREIRSTPLYRRSEEYWRKRLPTLPPAPLLPRVQEPCQVPAYRFSRRTTRLDPEVWGVLRRQALELGVTPAVVLMTAFASTLAAWTSDRRFTLNLTLFNRLPLHAEVGRLVGDFTTTTLLEVDLSQRASFSRRAQAIAQQLWNDMEHRYVSGVQVLRELAREHGARWLTSPVVFTSYMAGSAAPSSAIPSGLPIELCYGISQTPQVWLDHQVFELDGSLVMNWDSVDGLFPAGLIEDMFATNVQLLRALAQRPERWHDLSLPAAPAEQLALRKATNATAAPGSRKLLHELFLERAALAPQHPALITAHKTLSYGELSARARWLAQELHQRGVRKGELVAVVMRKGWEQVVAVLGTLCAGAAYLPIDPEWPAERVALHLTDGRVRFALTERGAPACGPLAAEVTWLGADAAPPADGVLADLPSSTQPEDLAYVIYTSGSTGQPKGVMIDHRGAVNTVLDVNERFGVGPSDRVLALSALTFDLSVYDVFGTLAAGATIVMPDHGARREPGHWMQLMQREQVTVWNSVPALLRMLIEGNPEHAALRDLRLVLLSGDWIAPKLARQARRAWPSARLISMGGATEASIWSILREVNEVPTAWTSIPYGRPMRNQRFYVLDPQLHECPDWVPGELYIGGIGLALGYFRDEARTAERFLVNPHTGERLYRTGDLGRALPDGEIELLGRVDRQVKIHGHRIELGEIEAALGAHPDVKSAVVVVRKQEQDLPQLAAYVVPADPALLPDAQQAMAGIVELAGSAQRLAPFTSGDPELDESLRLLDKLEERQRFKERERGRRPRDPSRPSWDLTHTSAAVAQRRSVRRYSLQPVARAQLAALLGALGQDAARRRPYGSAGGLYPVQLYTCLKPGRVADLPGGTYAYDPVSQQLEQLGDYAGQLREAYAPVINRPLFDEAAFALFLVVELAAVAPVYGDRSLHFAALEAGLMTQLLESRAPALGLGLCQIGELDETSLPGLLRLDRTQRLVHSLIGGRLPARPEGVERLPTVVDTREDHQLARALERVAELDDGQVAELLRAMEGL